LYNYEANITGNRGIEYYNFPPPNYPSI